MDYREFSQKVKSKYPDYADMDDRDLAQKMVAKFPGAYDDVVFNDAPNSQDDDTPRMASLGRAIMAAFKEAGGAASPFRAGPLIQGGQEFASSGAPGGMAALKGQDLPPDASVPSQIARQIMDPVNVATAGTSLVTGGASIPVRIAAQVAASGLARAGQAAAGGEDLAGALGEGAKTAAAVGSVEGLFGGAGKFLAAAKPKLAKLGAQMIRTTSGVPEKYGAAVLENPEILTKAHTLLGAREAYKATIKDAGGFRQFLKDETGKLIPKNQSVVDLVNDAVPKLADKTISLEEALAARQAASFLLQSAKYGNPEMRAHQAMIIGFKDELDDFVEVGMPGFKKANREYFEANAREAFESWLPQNKNLSPNVLRSLGALAALGSGALMNVPGLMMAAAPASPKVLGGAIRAGAAAYSPAALSAKFAARIAAAKLAANPVLDGTGHELPKGR